MNKLEQFLTLNISLNGNIIVQNELNSLLDKILESIKPLKKRSLVYLKMNHPLEFALSFLSLLENGHVPISISGKLSDYQVNEYLKESPHASLYHEGILTCALEEKEFDLFEKQEVYGTITSGTTSSPKICFLSVEKSLANAQAHCESIKLTKDHIIIQGLPVYHSFGIMAYIWSSLVLKMSLEFNTLPLGLKTIKKRNYSNGYLALSPSQLRFMLKEKTEGPFGVSIYSVGGGLVSKNELNIFSQKIKSEGSSLYVTYGLSEAGPRVSTAEFKESYKENSLGIVFPGIEIKLSSEGELLLKTPYSKLNIADYELESGFLKTRDIVEIHKDEMIFKSRKQDLIDVGGVSIYPKDIEFVVLQHQKVKDAIVLKKTHKLYGEVPLLFIESDIKSSDVFKEEMNNYLKEKLSILEMPSEIIILKSFPRTSLEKIDRAELIKIRKQTNV